MIQLKGAQDPVTFSCEHSLRKGKSWCNQAPEPCLLVSSSLRQRMWVSPVAGPGDLNCLGTALTLFFFSCRGIGKPVRIT